MHFLPCIQLECDGWLMFVSLYDHISYYRSFCPLTYQSCFFFFSFYSRKKIRKHCNFNCASCWHFFSHRCYNVMLFTVMSELLENFDLPTENDKFVEDGKPFYMLKVLKEHNSEMKAQMFGLMNWHTNILLISSLVSYQGKPFKWKSALLSQKKKIQMKLHSALDVYLYCTAAVP